MSNLVMGMFTQDGKRSWGRVSAFIALVFGLLWISKLVLLIQNPEQFGQLSTLSIFVGAVTTMVSALYGISKGLDAYQNVKNHISTPETQK